ncbi:Bifunctional nuclease 2 [Quillaja saponaria]|uniref:Bifunctional nuclease 2 n=1 Tax=Quillaja saponaria TaxID=32244 RepID=A0AAD7L839_QUISA|nr:Bifunctional nuclease 2 [Quillaja saponaria]
MLGAPFCVHMVSGVGTLTNQTNAIPSFSNSFGIDFASFHLSVSRLGFRSRSFRGPKSVLISCNSNRRDFGSRSSFGDHQDHEFLEASLLLSETISHYRMWKRGFREELTWKSSAQSVPFSHQAKDTRTDINSIGQSILHRFQSPTIFLKISCDGDYILPIIVGEFAIEKLIDAQWEHEDADSPDHFLFVRDLVERLGHEVLAVRITERVVNTYFARLYVSKPVKGDIFSLDARPSDAINVANSCKAPIYVSKEIVLADAIRIGYRMGRMRSTKSGYDVSLDSPVDGPDLLAKELDMVKNMHFAVKEERFKDAATLRDKLMNLRKSYGSTS